MQLHIRVVASAANRRRAAAVSAAEAVSWWSAAALVALVLLGALREESTYQVGARLGGAGARPCEVVYAVGEGETLYGISDRCGDPFIAERNPHVHDPDVVFPGLVIAMRPTKPT